MNSEALGHQTQATFVTARAVKMPWMCRHAAMYAPGDWLYLRFSLIDISQNHRRKTGLPSALMPSARAAM